MCLRECITDVIGSWRSSVRKASCKFEAERHEAAKEKRRGRKSEQRPYRPQPKPSSAQSAVGCAHQELASTATNEHARIDQPSKNPRVRGMSHHHHRCHGDTK